MRPVTLEEREHLCRLDKKIGGNELIDFVERVIYYSRKHRCSHAAMLSRLYYCPGATDIPEDQLKRTARKLHDQGQEMTPEQVGDAVASICHKIRIEMASKGYDMPESDQELMKHLKEIGVTW